MIMKWNGGYDWFKQINTNTDGCVSSSYNEKYLYEIIKNNRYNQNPKQYSCSICKSVNALAGSYISFVEEDDFLENPSKYIENAYNKSENDAEGYDLVNQR
mgnify:CR=1 FL=1